MAQFARPSADTLRDNWEGEGGETTNLFQHIDETSFSDTDYIRTVQTPTSDVYVCALSSVTDPLSSSNHVVRYRYGKDLAAGDQINLTIELRQGYVSEGTPGTLIATVATLTNISDGFTAGSYNLSGAEADAITDYTSLFLRFVGNKP